MMVGSDKQKALQIYVPLIVYTLLLLFPFYWMGVVSFKPTSDIFNLDLNPFWVQRFTFENYLYLFENTEVISWMWNTMLIAFVSTALSIFCSICIGYALARLKFPGSDFMGIGIFLVYLVPPTLLFIPMAEVIGALNLFNTHWALILTYPTQLIPFASWLLMGYFLTIPKEIEESALMDGLSLIHI